ncbi:MAG: ADP-heptose--lipopolysaccharide heptosyltransferase [Deltaproteobacteria bacterium]|nr:ADP-heptose--lipopolysaccharide heptosyltransferase [Deltaproteobacteria bacterium]
MKVLLFKPGAIGDLLQLTPVVRAIRGRMPESRITLMVGSAASAELFAHHPLVDEVLVFDRKGRHRSWRAFWSLWAEVRRRRFDLVVNYQRSNWKGWLLVAAAVPCRLLVYRKARGRVVHAVENHLEAVAALGIDPRTADRRLELHPGAGDVRWADELLEREGLAGRPLAALNPGASHPVNRWAAGHFAELAGRLHAELGVGVLLVGGPQDRELADAVAGGAGAPVVDCVGRASLLQTAALLSRCSVAVSGDTGPMHMATAVGTKVVALFGAADPARTGPVGEGHAVLYAREVPCVPCRSRECAHTPRLECMERITVDAVFEAVRRVLRSGTGAGRLPGP